MQSAANPDRARRLALGLAVALLAVASGASAARHRMPALRAMKKMRAAPGAFNPSTHLPRHARIGRISGQWVYAGNGAWLLHAPHARSPKALRAAEARIFDATHPLGKIIHRKRKRSRVAPGQTDPNAPSNLQLPMPTQTPQARH